MKSLLEPGSLRSFRFCSRYPGPPSESAALNDTSYEISRRTGHTRVTLAAITQPSHLIVRYPLIPPPIIRIHVTYVQASHAYATIPHATRFLARLRQALFIRLHNYKPPRTIARPLLVFFTLSFTHLYYRTTPTIQSLIIHRSLYYHIQIFCLELKVT